MTVDADFLAASGRALAEAARRHEQRRRRRRRILRAASASALAVAVMVSVVVARRHPAEAGGMRLRVGGSTVTVSIKRPYPAPPEVVRRLRDAGLAVQEVLQSTGPSKVDVTLGVSGDGGRSSPTSFVAPAHSTVSVLIGRLAQPGESYLAATDSFAPKEPLACLSGPGGSASDLAGRVSPGIVMRWQAVSGTEVIGAGDLDGRVVVRAASFGPHEAIVFVEPGKGKVRDNWCD